MARFGQHQTLKPLSLAMGILYQPQRVFQQIFQEKQHQFTSGSTWNLRCLIFQLHMEDYIPGLPLLTAEMSVRQASMYLYLLSWTIWQLFWEDHYLPVDH